MGMGGDLLRRKTLIRAVLCAAALLAAGGMGLPAEAPPTAPDRAVGGRALRAAPPDAGPLPAAGRPAGGPLAADPPFRGDSPLPASGGAQEGGEAAAGEAAAMARLLEEEAGNPVVQSFIREYQTRRRAEIEGALLRARPYRRFIAGRLRELDLPQELLWLPVIESGYRSRAVSRSGATGLWQLMRNTSRPFGIRVDEWVDERRDFWLATEVALRKLAENRRELGDWRLALAAYNHGLGGIKRILARAGTEDFWALRERGALPRETADYVPRYLAAAEICRRPPRYGFAVDWERSPCWERIELDRSVDLRILARAAQVPYPQLREGNAELNHPLTPTGRPAYRLKVPREYRLRVLEALADPQVKLARLQAHLIRTGDTLYALSRSYGVSVAMIQSWNPGLDPQRLRVGSSLFVPLIGAAGGASPAAGPAAAPAGPPYTGTYVVRPGDTLWAIARRFRTTPEAIAQANLREVGAAIRPGEALRVPDPVEAGILPEAGTLPDAEVPPGEGGVPGRAGT